MRPAVYLLLGFPGTGKYTVAQALAAELSARGAEVRVVDNHYVNNPVFGVIHTDGESALPEPIWDLVSQVRGAILSAIEDHAPPAWSFIFTNYITAEEAEDDVMIQGYLDRLEGLATRRGARLNVVQLTCAAGEVCRRIAAPDRRLRLKATSPAWVRDEMTSHSLFLPTQGVVLTLDLTSMPPADAAKQIVDHPWALD